MEIEKSSRKIRQSRSRIVSSGFFDQCRSSNAAFSTLMKIYRLCKNYNFYTFCGVDAQVLEHGQTGPQYVFGLQSVNSLLH